MVYFSLLLSTFVFLVALHCISFFYRRQPSKLVFLEWVGFLCCFQYFFSRSLLLRFYYWVYLNFNGFSMYCKPAYASLESQTEIRSRTFFFFLIRALIVKVLSVFLHFNSMRHHKFGQFLPRNSGFLEHTASFWLAIAQLSRKLRKSGELMSNIKDDNESIK